MSTPSSAPAAGSTRSLCAISPASIPRSSSSPSPTAPARSPSATLHRTSTDSVATTARGWRAWGTYAFRELGWRDAAVVLFNWDMGWGARDAFVGEFCSLGGRIGTPGGPRRIRPGRRAMSRASRADVDGVAVFVPSTFDPEGFLKRLAGRYADPSRHDPARTRPSSMIRACWGRPAGRWPASSAAPTSTRSGCAHYLAVYRQAFPVHPPTSPAANRSAAIAMRSRRCWPALEDAGGSVDRLPIGACARAGRPARGAGAAWTGIGRR